MLALRGGESVTVDIYISSSQGWGHWATAASACIAVTALIVAIRERVARRANLRLGVRNVHYFAWRMSDCLLSQALSETSCSWRRRRKRSEAELQAMEQGLDAISKIELEPQHLLQHSIELRFNWNLAAAYARGDKIAIDDLRYRLDRGRIAMRAFDAALFRDGAVLEPDPNLPNDRDGFIALPHGWLRWKYAAERWLLRRKEGRRSDG